MEKGTFYGQLAGVLVICVVVWAKMGWVEILYAFMFGPDLAVPKRLGDGALSHQLVMRETLKASFGV